MRIAVTGGIAEGKSTVMRYLQELGESTVSTDAMAREIFLEEGVQEALSLLLALKLPVEPHQVRQAIASDAELRRAVNRLMHPLILQRIDQSSATWFEVPLLLETCLQAAFHRVWVVTCGHFAQLERLTARLGSETEARRLIATQLPSTVKCVFADEVIRTNLPEAAVKSDVKLAVKREFAK